MTRKSSGWFGAAAVAAMLVFGAGHMPRAHADTTRQTHWVGVFGFQDCVWVCDWDLAGCETNPDCKCNCFL
jgi:hypothetical protein